MTNNYFTSFKYLKAHSVEHNLQLSTDEENIVAENGAHFDADTKMTVLLGALLQDGSQSERGFAARPENHNSVEQSEEIIQSEAIWRVTERSVGNVIALVSQTSVGPKQTGRRFQRRHRSYRNRCSHRASQGFAEWARFLGFRVYSSHVICHVKPF